MDNRVHWLWLAQVLGPDARLGPVLEQYGTAQAVYENRKDALSDRTLFSAAMHARMRDTTLEECEERLYAVLSSGYGVLCREDETFPERLKAFDTCPPVLYYMGDTALLDGFLNIGCVGSRRPQALFRNLTLRVCRSLAAAGVTLFSGFAAGIDADVHRAAYSADRGSVAVLPCGIDVAYPAENRGLRRMVVKKGAAAQPVCTRPSRLSGAFPPAQPASLHAVRRGAGLAGRAEKRKPDVRPPRNGMRGGGVQLPGPDRQSRHGGQFAAAAGGARCCAPDRRIWCCRSGTGTQVCMRRSRSTV